MLELHENEMKHEPRLYVELPGVSVNEENVPPSLRKLLPHARKWSFLNERFTYEHLEHTPMSEVVRFVNDCKNNLGELEKLCFDVEHPTPIPDEVVILQMMYNSFQAARVRVGVN
jgi:hypothetical protein